MKWFVTCIAMLSLCGCDAIISVEGNIVDGQGKPVEGATVELQMGANPKGPPETTTETGAYRVMDTYGGTLFGKPEIMLTAEKVGFKKHTEKIDGTKAYQKGHSITLQAEELQPVR